MKQEIKPSSLGQFETSYSKAVDDFKKSHHYKRSVEALTITYNVKQPYADNIILSVFDAGWWACESAQPTYP